MATSVPANRQPGHVAAPSTPGEVVKMLTARSSTVPGAVGRGPQPVRTIVSAHNSAYAGGGSGERATAFVIARPARLAAIALFVMAIALLLAAIFVAHGTAAWLEVTGAVSLLFGSYWLRWWARREALYRPLHERSEKAN